MKSIFQPIHYTLLMLILFLFFGVSCKQPPPKTPEVNNRNEPIKIEITKSLNLATEKEISETKEMYEKTLEQLDEFQKNNETVSEIVEALAQRVVPKYSGQAQIDIKNELKSIQGKQDDLSKAYQDILAKSQEINAFLQPDNLSMMQSQLLEDEIKMATSDKSIEKLSRAEKEKIKDNVVRKMKDEIVRKSSEVLALNQEMNILILRKNTIAFELRVLEGNNELKDFVWRINNKSFFQTGNNKLSVLGKRKLNQVVNAFFDSLLTKVEKIVAENVLDTNIHNAVLNVYVDGYADSQGFRDKSQSRWAANKKLSQKRSDEILRILLKCFEKKLKEHDLANISFKKPVGKSTGHGEELPYTDRNYAPDGQPDDSRRITLLQCTFFID